MLDCAIPDLGTQNDRPPFRSAIPSPQRIVRPHRDVPGNCHVVRESGWADGRCRTAAFPENQLGSVGTAHACFRGSPVDLPARRSILFPHCHALGVADIAVLMARSPHSTACLLADVLDDL